MVGTGMWGKQGITIFHEPPASPGYKKFKNEGGDRVDVMDDPIGWHNKYIREKHKSLLQISP